MGLLDGKVALVTGAGGGIGRAEALYLARCGAKVVVNDLGCDWDGTGADPNVAIKVAEEIKALGELSVANAADVSDAEQVESLIELALTTWNRLDIVVNNAGILRDWANYNMPIEDWDRVIEVHLRGSFLVTGSACRYWRERSKKGEAVSGRIINTTSVSGLFGNVGQANYGAAKAGVAALTLITAMEMQRYSVTVNAIAPAARTRLTENTFGPLLGATDEFDRLSPDNIAPLVAFLASSQSGHITGRIFGIHGGRIELYEGWKIVSSREKASRWEPSEIAENIDSLFGDRPPAYQRQDSTTGSRSGSQSE